MVGRGSVCGHSVLSKVGHFLTREKDKYIHAVISVWKRKNHVYTNSTDAEPQLEWLWYCNAQPIVIL